MGSYLCVLRLPGYRDVRYPVHITRSRSWTGLELPDFAIAKHPVTFGEYGEFLAALERERGIEEARRHAPQTTTDGLLVFRGEDGSWRPNPGNITDPPHARYLGDYGTGYAERIPILAVNWHDAVAYLEWKARTTGRPWRLPSDEEREKASRGVDGRRFPWGEREDAGLGKCRDSRDEPPQPEPVGTFPTAAGVYGAEDMAGNVWDWTDSWLDARQSARVLRGGAWLNAPIYLRCAYRLAHDPSYRNTNYGFRAARGFP
jgi:serine/threonine-protein kinase